MQYPLEYNGITQGFTKLGHKGIDEGWNMLHGGTHANVYSVEDGVVYDIQNQYTGGNVIIIKHDNGFFSEYGHLSTIKVKQGQKVKRGEYIANMGNTGHVYDSAKKKWVSVPYHLHFGLYKGDTFNYNVNNFVNPIDYLELYPNQSFSANTIKKYGSKLKYHKDDLDAGVYQTKYNMNLRTKPNGDKVKVKQCTTAMQKALTSKKPNDDAVVKKGTNFTALEIAKDGDSYWGKNYSGYICIKSGKKQYCDKVK